MLYQLSHEATDVGSRSIVGSYVLVKEMSVNDIWNKSYMNCGNEMKMKKWSSQWTQFMQLRKEAWKKIQDFNGVWTRDLAITGAMLYQLSYEATDVGRRSIVGSYVHMFLTAEGLVQSVVRLTAEREVAGSIPGSGTILRVLE